MKLLAPEANSSEVLIDQPLLVAALQTIDQHSKSQWLGEINSQADLGESDFPPLHHAIITTNNSLAKLMILWSAANP